MKRFSGKSILLGIGIGMILTSITSMVYMHGTSQTAVLSKDEVKKLAAEHGLIADDTTDRGIFSGGSPKQTEKQPGTGTASNPGSASSSTQSTTGTGGTSSTSSTTSNAAEPGKQAEYAILVINPGDTCEQVVEAMFNLGIITDKQAVLRSMIDSDTASRLCVGQYSLMKGSSTNTIIKAITLLP